MLQLPKSAWHNGNWELKPFSRRYGIALRYNHATVILSSSLHANICSKKHLARNSKKERAVEKGGWRGRLGIARTTFDIVGTESDCCTSPISGQAGRRLNCTIIDATC